MSDVERLIQLLGLSDESAVMQAVTTLSDLGDRTAVPALLRLLSSQASAAIRNTVALALRDLGDNRAVPALLKQIKEKHDARNIGTLIYALEPLNAQEGMVDLAKIMCHGVYEQMAMILRVFDAFDRPLQPRQQVEAIHILVTCLQQGGFADWQREMIEAALDLLE